MAHFNYCPICDKLVQRQLGACSTCKGSTLQFSYRIEPLHRVFLLTFIPGLIGPAILFFLFDIWNFLLFGGLIFFGLVGGGVVLMMLEFKNATENGRNLYNLNKNRFDSKHGLDLREIKERVKTLSWSIRHMNALRAGFVISIGTGILTFVATRFYLLPFTFFQIFIFFSLVAMVFFSSSRPASKFAKIIREIKPHIESVHSERSSTLRISTNDQSVFRIHWERSHGIPGIKLLGSIAHYEVWISTKKNIPLDGKWRKTIWERQPFYEKFRNSKAPEFSVYITPSQIEHIKSISKLRFEAGEEDGKIAAILDDWIFRFEIPDILKAVDLLRDIEARL